MTNYENGFQIKEAGLYQDMPAELYHSDPCPSASLSNSLIRELLDKSPLHAAWQHPRLINKTNRKTTDAMTKGTLLHKLLLGAGSEIAIIDAEDYRGKAARENRDQALAENKTPVLARIYDEVCNCTEITKENIRNHPACQGFFDPGISEAVLAWQEQDIWCRAMLDRLPNDRNLPIFDLKSTELSASQVVWDKRLRDVYRTQGVFYDRGLEKLGMPRREPMRYIVVELNEPYALNVFCPSEELIELASSEVDRAIRIWSHCMKTNEWKGYPDCIIEVEPKPWMLDQVSDQEVSEEFRGF